MVGAVRHKTGRTREREKRGGGKCGEWRKEMQGSVQKRKEGEMIQREKRRESKRRRVKEYRKVCASVQK